MLYLKTYLLLINIILTSIITFGTENPHSNTFYDKKLSYSKQIHAKQENEPFYKSIILEGAVQNNKIALPVRFLISNETQTLLLSVSTTAEGLYLFSDESPNCKSPTTENLSYDNICYNASAANKANWCLPNLNPCSIENLCLTCNEYSLSQEPHEYSTFIFDGYPINDTRIQGNDSFSITAKTTLEENSQTTSDENSQTTSDEKSSNFTFNNYPIQLIKQISDFPGLPLVTTLDGILGISGPQICFRGKSLWNDIMKKVNLPIFGIDYFVPINQNNTSQDKAYANFLIGEAYKSVGDVIWSERRQTGDSIIDALFGFTIYDLNLCGSNLLDGLTSNWEAEIDTNSQCLVLPPFIYENLLSWAPVTESSYENPDNNEIWPSYTKLLVHENYTQLPTLSFKLNQFSKDLFYIPLSSLVYYDTQINKNVLCVQKRIKHPQGVYASKSIGFGLSVLNILYPAIDFRGSRVGLIQKQPPSDIVKTNKSCQRPASCIGKQMYIPSSNSCKDPSCSEYYFMTLDNDTKECKIAGYAFPMAFSLILVLSISEFGISIFYYHLVKVTEAHSK